MRRRPRETTMPIQAAVVQNVWVRMCLHVFVCVTTEVQTRASLLEVVSRQRVRFLKPYCLGSNSHPASFWVKDLVNLNLAMPQLSCSVKWSLRYRPPKVAGRLYRLILVMSKVQYLESTDLPLIDTVFIQPKLPLTPTDWCFVAAKGYATIYLNTKSPKSFGWSHHPLTKSLLVKGSLGPVYTGWVSSAGLALHLKVTKSRLSRSLLTQSNQSRAEEALCGGGSDGRLANFTGSHFVALAKSAAVCWNKSGAKI